MSRWIAGSVTVNGINLHYYRTGGDKPPLVFAHGLTDNALCWAPVVKRLETAYDCIMVDARGHGYSDAPENGYTNDDHAADYAGLIQTLKLDRPVMIGHSMGGGTSAQLAASYPELVRAVVLEDPPWRPQGPSPSPEERRANAESWRADLLRNQEQSLESLLAQGKQQRPTWSAAELDQWAPSKQQVSPRALDCILYPSKPWWEIIDQIQCPTLLVIGEGEGAIVDAATAAQISQRNPQVSVASIAGAGHSIRREGYHDYVAAVSDFIAKQYA